MDVIDRLNQIILSNNISADTAKKISESIRYEYQGSLVYIPKRSEQQKERIQNELRSGAYYKTVAGKYRISERTALRWLHKVRIRNSK